jgi:hypothetical protein
MSRAIPLIASMSLLLGCAPGVKDAKLEDVDLSDMKALQAIRAQLNAEDGAAFASYVVRHSVASASFCGRPLAGPDGKPPRTVGEAIDLALDRDAADRRALALEGQSEYSRPRAQEQWDDLISERDMLINAQSVLRADHGAFAERRSEWKALEARIAHINDHLSELEPLIYGPDKRNSK